MGGCQETSLAKLVPVVGVRRFAKFLAVVIALSGIAEFPATQVAYAFAASSDAETIQAYLKTANDAATKAKTARETAQSEKNDAEKSKNATEATAAARRAETAAVNARAALSEASTALTKLKSSGFSEQAVGAARSEAMTAVAAATLYSTEAGNLATSARSAAGNLSKGRGQGATIVGSKDGASAAAQTAITKVDRDQLNKLASTARDERTKTRNAIRIAKSAKTNDAAVTAAGDAFNAATRAEAAATAANELKKKLSTPIPKDILNLITSANEDADAAMTAAETAVTKAKSFQAPAVVPPPEVAITTPPKPVESDADRIDPEPPIEGEKDPNVIPPVYEEPAGNTLPNPQSRDASPEGVAFMTYFLAALLANALIAATLIGLYWQFVYRNKTRNQINEDAISKRIAEEIEGRFAQSGSLYTAVVAPLDAKLQEYLNSPTNRGLTATNKQEIGAWIKDGIAANLPPHRGLTAEDLQRIASLVDINKSRNVPIQPSPDVEDSTLSRPGMLNKTAAATNSPQTKDLPVANSDLSRVLREYNKLQSTDRLKMGSEYHDGISRFVENVKARRFGCTNLNEWLYSQNVPAIFKEDEHGELFYFSIGNSSYCLPSWGNFREDQRASFEAFFDGALQGIIQVERPAQVQSDNGEIRVLLKGRVM